MHGFIEQGDLVAGADVGVAADEGVVHEGVSVGGIVEQLAGVAHGGGEEGGEREEFGG